MNSAIKARHQYISSSRSLISKKLYSTRMRNKRRRRHQFNLSIDRFSPGPRHNDFNKIIDPSIAPGLYFSQGDERPKASCSSFPFIAATNTASDASPTSTVSISPLSSSHRSTPPIPQFNYNQNLVIELRQTPAIIRLQQLLENLPDVHRLSFFAKLELHQLQGMSFLLASLLQNRPITCANKNGSINCFYSGCDVPLTFQSSDGSAKSSSSVSTTDFSLLNASECPFSSSFTFARRSTFFLTAGVELDKFWSAT